MNETKTTEPDLTTEAADVAHTLREAAGLWLDPDPDRDHVGVAVTVQVTTLVRAIALLNLLSTSTDTPVDREWAANIIDTDEIMGLGPTTNRDAAQQDVTDWCADGYAAQLVTRPVYPWRPATSPDSSTPPVEREPKPLQHSWYHNGDMSIVLGRLCIVCRLREHRDGIADEPCIGHSRHYEAGHAAGDTFGRRAERERLREVLGL